MRLVLALSLAALVPSALSAEPAHPDPLAVLITQLSAPLDEKAADAPSPSAENSAHLARIQSSLTVAAAGFEALRSPAHEAAAKEALANETDPALKPFTKGRDASLDAVYRTLAVIDYTWALRFPKPSCAPAERRRALLQSADGLFVDPDVGTLSPWMQRLLGPDSFGRAPEEALDRASSAAKLTESAYEKLRVRATRITEDLAADKADGSARTALYCERAGIYEQLARSHAATRGPTLASRSVEYDDAAAAGSVFLLAASNGNDYDALGAGFLVQTGTGPKLVTDASIVRGRKRIYAFSHPASDGTFGRPIPVAIERAASGVGPAIGSLAVKSGGTGLTLSKYAPATDDIVRGLGPVRAAGPWTETQGLVTGVGAATFQSDAVLSAEMAGSPVLNDHGEAVGIMIRRGDEVTALKAEKLQAFLDGEGGDTSDAEFIASRNSGSASLLTTARPVDEYAWSAPGASAIESGLPTNLGGVNWEGGGGVGGFRPSGYAGGSSGFAPRSSGYDSGGSEERIGSALGDALAQVAVIGLRKLIGGIYSLFQPKPDGEPSRQVATQKAAPPPPPPPPPEPKIIGLTVTVEPPDALPGQRVTLIGQLKFQGDYKDKSGIPVAFGVGGRLAYFGDAEHKSRSETEKTDSAGQATATLTLEEIVADNSKIEMEGLDREVRRRDGTENEPSIRAEVAIAGATPTRKVKDNSAKAQDELDTEESSSQPESGVPAQESPTAAASQIEAAAITSIPPSVSAAAMPQANIAASYGIHITAGAAGFGTSTDIHAARNSDCPEGQVAVGADRFLSGVPGRGPELDPKKAQQLVECHEIESRIEDACNADITCIAKSANELRYFEKGCEGRWKRLEGAGATPGLLNIAFRSGDHWCVPRSASPNDSRFGRDEGLKSFSKNSDDDAQGGSAEEPRPSEDKDAPARTRGLAPDGIRPPGFEDSWSVRDASRPSEVKKGGKSYWDPKGGEWRYFPEDKYHFAHWDYNSHSSSSSPWENIPLNPGEPTHKGS